MTPSDALVAQTTTAVPTAVMVPVLATAWLIVIYRIAIIRDRRPTTTAAHWYATAIIAYATLRVPEVQDVLIAHTNLTLGDLRVAGAVLQVWSAAALLLLGLRWRSVSGRTHGRTMAWTVAGVVVLACAIAWVHWPARNSGIAIEELDGSWRTGAYLTMHSILYLPAELIIVATLFQMARGGTPTRRLLAGMLCAAIVASAVNLVSVMVGGWLISADISGPWSEPRSSVRNDVALYPTLLPWLPVGIPAVAAHVAATIGLDRRQKNRLRDLHPLWRSLTTLAPDYRLAEVDSSATLPSMAEREHRMRTEIEDIVHAVARYLPEDARWPDDPLARAEMLRSACSRYDPDQPGSTNASLRPRWSANESAVDEVARAWVSTSGLSSSPPTPRVTFV